MAHTLSALKRIRQAQKRRLRNRSVKSALKTQIKKVLGAINLKDLQLARSELTKAYKLLDQAAAKGVIHRNKASRHKSRLARHVATLIPTEPEAQIPSPLDQEPSPED
jgi:small subunit ribosomal protein S20